MKVENLKLVGYTEYRDRDKRINSETRWFRPIIGLLTGFFILGATLILTDIRLVSEYQEAAFIIEIFQEEER